MTEFTELIFSCQKTASALVFLQFGISEKTQSQSDLFGEAALWFERFIILSRSSL